MDWYDRVVEKVKSRREQADADAEMFNDLRRYLSNPKSWRDGESLALDGDGGILSYKKKDVLTFSVKKGEVIVTGGADGEKRFTDREAALDHMAMLMAVAVEDYEDPEDHLTLAEARLGS